MTDAFKTTTIWFSPYWQALVAGEEAHADAILRALGGAAAAPPQPGTYKRRFVKGGPWRGARVWVVEHRDRETGALSADVEYHCEVDGVAADALAQWSWLLGRAVEQSEFEFLRADAGWQARSGVDPRKPVDTSQLPHFGPPLKEKTQ